MNSVRHTFADLTASLEGSDVIVVERQSPDETPDYCALLAGLIESRANAIRRRAAMTGAIPDER